MLRVNHHSNCVRPCVDGEGSDDGSAGNSEPTAASRMREDELGKLGTRFRLALEANSSPFNPQPEDDDSDTNTTTTTATTTTSSSMSRSTHSTNRSFPSRGHSLGRHLEHLRRPASSSARMSAVSDSMIPIELPSRPLSAMDPSNTTPPRPSSALLFEDPMYLAFASGWEKPEGNAAGRSISSREPATVAAADAAAAAAERLNRSAMSLPRGFVSHGAAAADDGDDNASEGSVSRMSGVDSFSGPLSGPLSSQFSAGGQSVVGSETPPPPYYPSSSSPSPMASPCRIDEEGIGGAGVARGGGGGPHHPGPPHVVRQAGEGEEGSGLLGKKEAEQLHALAKQLVDAGGISLCVEHYRTARLRFVKDQLVETKIEEIKLEALNGMAWSNQEAAMKGWLRDADLVVQLLFEGERQLCSLVFRGLPLSWQQDCFDFVVRGTALHAAAMQLQRNAAAFAASERNPEKLFALLDMFNMAYYLAPLVEKMFRIANKSTDMEEWWNLPRSFAAAVMGVLDDLRRRLSDAAKPASPAPRRRFKLPLFHSSMRGAEVEDEEMTGDVHPTTSYVVNYVLQYMDKSSAANYGTTVEVIFSEYVDEKNRRRSLDRDTGRLLEALGANMEGKAAGIADPMLRAIFLLNNCYRVLQCMLQVNSMASMRQRERMDLYVRQFQSLALAKVCSALGPSGQSADLEPKEVKLRLKRFNAAFEELALEQRAWLIANDECRRMLRNKIATTIKDLYSEFLMPHREQLCMIPTYHWSPDGIVRIVKKSFFLNRAGTLVNAVSW